MFHYTFQDKNCLIQHITIIGNAISFYLNKFDEHDSPEFDYLKSQCKLEDISGDDLRHYFLHSKHSTITTKSRNSSQRSFGHVHFSFAGEPIDMLKKIAYCLNAYQNDFQARENSYNQCRDRFNALMIKAGIEKTPECVQVILDNYDVDKAFIPCKEIGALLESFELYLDPQNPMQMNESVYSFFLELIADKGTKNILLANSDDYLNKYAAYLLKCKDGLSKYDTENDPQVKQKLFDKAEALHDSIVSPATVALIVKLNTYIKRVESQKLSNGQTDFSSGFWFFAASRSINREANFLLATDLLEKLKRGVKVADAFRHIDDSRQQIITQSHLSLKRDFVDRGINSSELNAIIDMAKETIPEQASKASSQI